MKNRKLWISILSGIMAGLMLLGLILSILPSTVFAVKSSEEIQEELKDLQQQQDELAGKMSSVQGERSQNQNSVENVVAQKNNLDQQIGLLSTEIDNLNAQIQSCTQQIADKQTELDQAESVLRQMNEKNRDRIRAMEEEGKVSYWSVLFKAKSFTDLVDRLNMMEEIQRADQRRLDELSKAAKAVADARQALEDEKNTLQQAYDDQINTQKALDTKRTEADELLVQLNDRQKELEDLSAQYAQMEQSLSADIAAAEKAYTDAKRQEEEASKPEPPEGGDSSGEGEQTAPPSSGGWVTPCSYVEITSPYGWRVHPITGAKSFHSGVDLANDYGTPIYAAHSGTVTAATHGEIFGFYVTINHGDGYSTLYGHMTNYVVSEGEEVSAGQLIGYMGDSGWATGPHLHFTVYYEGNTVEPMDFI